MVALALALAYVASLGFVYFWRRDFYRPPVNIEEEHLSDAQERIRALEAEVEAIKLATGFGRT